MKVISVINQKGGVGKTTTTYNLAAVLAGKGHRVLMIDNDGQASLTLACGFNPIDLDITMADVYIDNKKIANTVIETDVNNLDVAPATIKLTSAETLLINKYARENVLNKKLKEVSMNYDYVLIDNPPHLGLLTINSLIASDYVVVPCATNPLATYALEDLFNTIDEIKDINTKLKVLGVVATIYNKVAKLDNDELDYLRSNYEVIGIIKRSVDASKGLEQGLPAVQFNPKSDVSLQYKECAENILKAIEGGN